MSDASSADQFRRALSAATRAISHDRALDVKFGGDAALARGKVVLPNPPDKMTAKDAALLRGKADALALRLQLHNSKSHQTALPPGAQARKIFDAAEQARVEALGARAMRGVADNLDAALADRCRREGWNHAEDRQTAPLEDAISMLVRERVTGRPVPEDAKGLMQVWREDLESHAGSALDALAGAVDDQASFAEALRQVIRDLDLTDELGEHDQDEDDTDDSEDDAGVEQEPEAGEEDTDSDPDQGEDEDDAADAKGTAADTDDIHFAEDSQTRVEADDEPSETQQHGPIGTAAFAESQSIASGRISIDSDSLRAGAFAVSPVPFAPSRTFCIERGDAVPGLERRNTAPDTRCRFSGYGRT